MNNYSVIVLYFVAICIISCQKKSEQEIATLYEGAKELYKNKEYNMAYDSAYVCYRLAQQANNVAQKGEALNLLGVLSRKLGKHTEALDYYLQALSERESINDKKGLANTFMNIGNLYKDHAGYDIANSYFNKANSIGVELKDESLIEIINYNRGVAYYREEKYDSALYHFQKSLKINESLNNQNLIAGISNYIGACFNELNIYDSAIQYYQKVLELRKAKDQKEKIAQVYNNLAITYYYKDNLPAATNSTLESVALGFEERQLYAYNILCDIYEKQAHNDKVIEFAEKAIPLAEKYTNNKELLKAYKHVSKAYFEKKEYSKAQDYWEKSDELKNSIAEKQKAFYLAALAQTNVFKKLEIQHQVNKAALLTAEKWSAKQGYWLITTLVLVVAFVAAGTTLLKKHRSLRSVASTFPVYVRNSLVKIGGLSYYAQHFPDDALKRIKTLDRTIDTISDQLFSFEHRVKHGLYAPERFDLGAQINSILKNHYHLAEAKKTSIINNVAEGYFINTHKKTFLRAIELLLQESIKDTKRETMVIVELKPYHEALWLTITDYRPRYKSYYEDTTIIKTLKEMGAVVSIEPQTKELFKIVIAFDLA